MNHNDRLVLSTTLSRLDIDNPELRINEIIIQLDDKKLSRMFFEYTEMFDNDNKMMNLIQKRAGEIYHEEHPNRSDFAFVNSDLFKEYRAKARQSLMEEFEENDDYDSIFILEELMC